jgi:hypothetical protein
MDTNNDGKIDSSSGSVRAKSASSNGMKTSSGTAKADPKVEVGLMVLMILYGWM